MAQQESIYLIQQVRKQYVQAKLWLYALQAGAVLVLAFALLLRWQLDSPVLIVSAISIAIAAILYFILRWKSVSSISLLQVARHLNRKYPELQDSTELLLDEPANLLQQIQQQRVAATLHDLRPELKRAYTIRSSTTYIVASLVLLTSVGIVYLPANLVADQQLGNVVIEFPDNSTAITDTSLTIEEIEIIVTPPAYTQKSSYKAKSPNLSIEEGATVSWRIITNKAAKSLKLELSSKELIEFKAQGKEYILSRKFSSSKLYTINLNGQKSAFYTLEIIPDEAPTIQIQKPKQYTEILFGQPQQITLQVQLTDDYGIREASMIATVAKGSGEAVKFREEKIKLNLQGNSKHYNIQQILNLQKLGMTYGDELYFYLQAWDNHKGYTRTETFFVQIEDTTIIESSFDLSMGVNPVPEYFRSQRQIIIDTEKLLKDQKGLSRTIFEERSNNLGIDQKLLRLRYGKFLGEEFESGIGPGGGIPKGEEGHQNEEHFPGDGHDHEEFSDQSSPEALLSPYMHKHDQEGEATIFEPAVKAKLKGALAQMWEAELRLRTHRPREALPFEYKALRMLKEVQQSHRAYVAKTGFEAPPLKEPELRLSGELDKILSPSDQKEIPLAKQLINVRAALNCLGKYKQTQSYTIQDIVILEKAGQEYAQQTLQKQGSSLKVLQDLRTIITEMQAEKALCRNCITSIERGFTNILPPAKPTPQPQQKSRSKLSQEYYKQLK